jgi:hypothetical protein
LPGSERLSSSRFSVDLPATSAQSARRAGDWPARIGMSGHVQMVVVVQVFIAGRRAKHALPHRRADLVFDQAGAAVVQEAGSKPIHRMDRPIRRAQ